MSTDARVGQPPDPTTTLPWVPTAVVTGLALAGIWALWGVSTLEERLLRDAVLFLVVPLGLAGATGRDIGWRVDRAAIRSALYLSAVVLPVYVVGSTLPGVRSAYPVGAATSSGLAFCYRAGLLLALVVAAETFFRGLLCVGIRRIGPVAILVSPVLYALQHVGNIPLELALAAPADVLFGAVDYRTGSILPSIAAHGTGLLVLEYLTMHPPLFAPGDVLAIMAV